MGAHRTCYLERSILYRRERIARQRFHILQPTPGDTALERTQPLQHHQVDSPAFLIAIPGRRGRRQISECRQESVRSGKHSSWSPRCRGSPHPPLITHIHQMEWRLSPERPRNGIP